MNTPANPLFPKPSESLPLHVAPLSGTSVDSLFVVVVQSPSCV